MPNKNQMARIKITNQGQIQSSRYSWLVIFEFCSVTLHFYFYFLHFKWISIAIWVFINSDFAAENSPKSTAEVRDFPISSD